MTQASNVVPFAPAVAKAPLFEPLHLPQIQREKIKTLHQSLVFMVATMALTQSEIQSRFGDDPDIAEGLCEDFLDHADYLEAAIELLRAAAARVSIAIN